MKSLFDRAAVLAYVTEHGRTTTDELRAIFGRDQSAAAFAGHMKYMVRLDLVKNVGQKNRMGIWVAVGPKPPEPETQGEPEPCFYPRYCLEVVPPPRQNDHRHSVYTPAQVAPARAGSQDFLQYPSRGHRC